MEKGALQCLTPDCVSPPKGRGLCSKCHAHASNLVKHEKTSWQELEEMGLAVPLKGRGKESKFLKAFESRKMSREFNGPRASDGQRRVVRSGKEMS